MVLHWYMSLAHQTFVGAGHHQQADNVGSEELNKEDVDVIIVLSWGISRFLMRLKEQLDMHNLDFTLSYNLSLTRVGELLHQLGRR